VVAVVAAVTVAGSVVIVVVLARMGQGGARLTGGGTGPAGDRTLDAHWRWGQLYVNRADPAFFVEKRFGIGYTLNFGHPLWWVFFVGLLVPLALALLMTRS